MANTLNELIKTLSGSREGDLPTSRSFRSPNTKEIYQELDLASRAKELGEENIPFQNDAPETSPEDDILAEIERRAMAASEEYHSQLELYESRIRSVNSLSLHDAEIIAAGEGALTDFDVQVQHDLDRLHGAQEQVQGREKEFLSFQKTNHLDRLPNIISRRKSRIVWVTCVLIIFIETFINGTFFAKGSEAGFIGGVLEAVVLSFLNVGIAALFAFYGRPLLPHVRSLYKIFGGLALLAYINLAIGLNLLIGHYRDFFAINHGDVHLAEVLYQLKNSPLGLDEASSLFLVMLGIGLSIIAYIELSSLKDPYHGYGKVGELRRVALTSYQKEKSECYQGLQERRDKVIDRMLRIIELIRSAEFEYHRAMDGRSRLQRNYRLHLQELGRIYISLIRGYREANVRARTEDPPPDYLKQPSLPSIISGLQEEPLPSLSIELKSDCIKLMESFVEKINQKFKKASKKYASISSVVTMGGVDIEEK